MSDAGVLAAGWVERALPHLAEVRVEWRLWHDLTPNPEDAEIEAAFESYLERILDYEGIDHAQRESHAATNPRPVTEDDVRRICLAAY